jgi:hypothetical protein
MRKRLVALFIRSKHHADSRTNALSHGFIAFPASGPFSEHELLAPPGGSFRNLSENHPLRHLEPSQGRPAIPNDFGFADFGRSRLQFQKGAGRFTPRRIGLGDHGREQNCGVPRHQANSEGSAFHSACQRPAGRSWALAIASNGVDAWSLAAAWTARMMVQPTGLRLRGIADELPRPGM